MLCDDTCTFTICSVIINSIRTRGQMLAMVMSVVSVREIHLILLLLMLACFPRNDGVSRFGLLCLIAVDILFLFFPLAAQC